MERICSTYAPLRCSYLAKGGNGPKRGPFWGLPRGPKPSVLFFTRARIYIGSNREKELQKGPPKGPPKWDPQYGPLIKSSFLYTPTESPFYTTNNNKEEEHTIEGASIPT